MRTIARSMAVFAGSVLLVGAITVAPASAATTNIGASAAAGVVTVPASTNVAVGDTGTLTNTGSSTFVVLTGSTCSGQDFGSVIPGLSITLATFSNPTYTVGQTVPFSISFGAVCQPFSVAVVAAPPPPTLPESPFTIALPLVALVLLGGGFFLYRRRRVAVA